MPRLNHVHFIGICGVALSAEAIAFKNAGYKVTGSDKGFYPPISTALEAAGVPFYAGWHPENMARAGNPDLVVAISYANESNPEIIYAKKSLLQLKSQEKKMPKAMKKLKTLLKKAEK